MTFFKSFSINLTGYLVTNFFPLKDFFFNGSLFPNILNPFFFFFFCNSFPPFLLLSVVTAVGVGTSVGLWLPVCDGHLPELTGGGLRGALYEENLLQAPPPLLHSLGHWHTLLQRPVPTHPRGSGGTRGVGVCVWGGRGACSATSQPQRLSGKAQPRENEICSIKNSLKKLKFFIEFLFFFFSPNQCNLIDQIKVWRFVQLWEHWPLEDCDSW